MTFKKSVACLTHPPPFRAKQPKLCPQAPQNRCPWLQTSPQALCVGWARGQMGLWDPEHIGVTGAAFRA